RFDRRFIWIAGIALLASVPLLAAVLLAPVHTSRQLPTVAFLNRTTTWIYYWGVLPGVVGGPALAFGAASVAAAWSTPKWRGEAGYVGSWILVLILTLSLLPARDPRYVLLVAPAFILAAAIGVAWAAERVPPLATAWQIVVLAIGLV